jgi:hypothetical protein
MPATYELLYTQNKSLALPLWTKYSVTFDRTEAVVSDRLTYDT